MARENITQRTNQVALIICMALAIVICIIRSIARWKVRKVQLEDAFLWFGLASFLGMCAIYLAVLPVIYPLLALEAGVGEPWPSVLQDAVWTLKMFFAVQLLFWSALWGVKFSLLWMFRRLTLGLSNYMLAWTIITVFTFLSFVGCVVSEVTSCSSMTAWFTLNACQKPQDAVAKAASLYYSLAVDLLTDMLIMVIPIRLLWNLQISAMEKIGLAVAFSVGIITMICAIVRVISLDSTVTAGQVNTTWLMLWGAIEGLVAIVVGCLPAFAVFVRTRVATTRRSNYANNSHELQSSQKQSKINSRARTESILLEDVEQAPQTPVYPEAPGASSWKASSTWLTDRDSDEDRTDPRNSRGRHQPINVMV